VDQEGVRKGIPISASTRQRKEPASPFGPPPCAHAHCARSLSAIR
jgi:hypothetical protein